MAIAHLKLSIDETGHGSILLNDIDISKFVKGIQFEASPGGELTTVGLVIVAEVNADITVKLEKIGVKVELQPPPKNAFNSLSGKTVPINAASQSR